MTPEELQSNINIWRKDFELYAKNNLYIINKDAELVPFVLNRMQRKVWKLIFILLVQGIPIRILCIKDRQIGFTTLIAAIFYWLCTLYPNKNALIAAQDIDAAGGIFDKVKLFFKKSPDELKPLRKISNRRELYFANPDESGELGLESRILIDTADSKELGVSKTIQLVLLSELAIWEAMGLDIKSRLVALKQAIPKRSGTMIVIETTPRGEGYVSQMYFNEDNGYEKIFITSVADEQYRIELDPNNYFELIDYDEHKYGNEVDEYFLYENEVKIWYPEIDYNTIEGKQKLHHEVMCRLAWRRGMIDDECEGSKEYFDREYPITIEKAFASSGSKIFPQKILADTINYLKSSPAILIYYKYEQAFDDFMQSSGGHLKVFQEPHPEFKYVIGADVGQGGQGGDNSSSVCRRLPDLKQVFTFNDVLDALSYARVINRLAIMYNNAFTGVETNEKGGYAVVEYLLNKFYYRNLYVREVIAQVRGGVKKEQRYGWNTSKSTKPIMIADLIQAIKDGLEILDLVELEQIKKYQLIVISDKFGNTKTLTGVLSGRDDLAIAEMICLQLPKFVFISQHQSPKKTKWTLDWWAKQINNYDDTFIGANSKGPVYLND